MDVASKNENGTSGSLLREASEKFLLKNVSTALTNYEIRPPQTEMLRACAGNIEKGGILFAEAGTGTGKTFAYLIPAILSGKRAIVTTRTINLQEQLVSKDLRFLASLKDFDYAIAKGRAHYLCKRRLNAFKPADREEGEEHRDMLEWLQEAETGEIEDYIMGRRTLIWDRVSSDADACKGKKCAYYRECYYFVARNRWAKSQVVVANHALLAVNSVMDSDSRLLPETDILVVDEAHALDPVFSEQIGIRITDRGMDRLYGRLLRPDERGHYKGLLSASPALFPIIESLRLESSLFWQQLGKEMKSKRGIKGSFPLAYALTALAESIRTLVKQMKTSLTGLFEEDDEIEVSAMVMKLSALASDMDVYCTETPGFIRWTEIDDKKKVLRMSPVYPSEFIRDNLLPGHSSIILTSATLSVSGDFGLVEKTLGIGKARKISVASPFDLRKQVEFEIRRGIDLRNESGIADLASAIIEEASREEGGTLILFTSRDVMKRAWDLASGRLLEAGLNPMVQGEIPNRRMLETMRESRNTVLFGLDSFWEGVDVRGDALKCLIITKLPFEVPTEPIVEARTEMIEERGGNPFYEYSLPKAVLKFRQGIGRLIRTKTDTGRIIVCDDRIVSKAYGKSFLANLH